MKPKAVFRVEADGSLVLESTSSVTYPLREVLKNEYSGKFSSNYTGRIGSWRFPNTERWAELEVLVRPQLEKALEGYIESTRRRIESCQATLLKKQKQKEREEFEKSRYRFMHGSHLWNRMRRYLRPCECVNHNNDEDYEIQTETCLFCMSVCCKDAKPMPDGIGKLHTRSCFTCDTCKITKCMNQPQCSRHYFVSIENGCKCTLSTLCVLCATVCCKDARRMPASEHAVHTNRCYECDVHNVKKCVKEQFICNRMQMIPRENGCECTFETGACAACQRACCEKAVVCDSQHHEWFGCSTCPEHGQNCRCTWN